MSRKIQSIDHVINKKIHRWTILEDYGRINKSRIVKAICICGKIKNMDFGEIKRGKSKSCGCEVRSDVKNFINKKFNKLTIIEDCGIINKKTHVKVICDCGFNTVCRFDSVISGLTKSCGCLNSESVTKHGLSSHPLFTVWLSMRQRCNDKNCGSYKNYGGIGVVVCEEWQNNFQYFYNWAIDSGWVKGLQLDKDILSPFKPGKLYSPDFCCFVTCKENSRHRRNSVSLTLGNETMNMADWCDRLDMPYALVGNRIRLGWDAEKALMEPLNIKYSH